MNWAEFYQYIKPIAGRRSIEYRPKLDIAGWKWEREKFEQKYQRRDPSNVVSPFKYIKGRYSFYDGIGVYAYIANAMEKEQKTIRLDPTHGMIPYFLEAIRFDEVLAEHLVMTKEQDILIITINTE